jgi:hypothetical protein
MREFPVNIEIREMTEEEGLALQKEQDDESGYDRQSGTYR